MHDWQMHGWQMQQLPSGMHSSFPPAGLQMHGSFEPAGLQSHGSFPPEHPQLRSSSNGIQQQLDMRRTQSHPPQLQSPGRAAAAHNIMPASPMGAPPARRGHPEASHGQATSFGPPDPGGYLPAAQLPPLQQQREWLSARIARFGVAAGTPEQPLRGIPITHVPPNFVQVLAVHGWHTLPFCHPPVLVSLFAIYFRPCVSSKAGQTFR